MLVDSMLGGVTNRIGTVGISMSKREEQPTVTAIVAWNLPTSGHLGAVVRNGHGGHRMRQGKRKLMIPGIAGQQPMTRVPVVGLVDT